MPIKKALTTLNLTDLVVAAIEKELGERPEPEALVEILVCTVVDTAELFGIPINDLHVILDDAHENRGQFVPPKGTN